MVSLMQIQNGVAKYLDEEFINKLDGWQKWVFGAFSTMALLRIDELFLKVKNNEFVKLLNVIDEYDYIDLESLFEQFSKQAQKGAITFSLPMIGKVTLNSVDVEKIYRYIKEAQG